MNAAPDDTSAAVRDRAIADMNEIKQQNAELLARLAVLVRDKQTLHAALTDCARELEKVWTGLGQVNPNSYVTAARAVLARVVI